MPVDEKTAPDIPEALAAERAYLAAARAELARMRDRTLALDADKAGGSALASEYLKGALYYRAQALIDDPDTPLFFGRLDMSTDPEPGAAADPDETTYYVGRRHVHDDDGDPVVVDWRADVSRAFYRATSTEPMDVVLRRRFGFDRGHITAYEDEHLLAPRAGDARTSRILATEIERPRVGPMRDIVATIQPEQDVIVRADVNETVCVQGAPGTGKTAVGLHRAAYLLYAFRDRLRRGGVLIVGPNATFLSYIAAVLPALGEVDVRQVTVDDLVTGVRVRGVDSADVAMLKGDARMATVLHKAVYARLASAPTEPLVLNRGSRRWRVPAYELAELVGELTRRDVRYGSGRAMLAQRLAHSLLTKMESAGESPDDRVQDAVARSGPVKAMVDALWPAVDPIRLVFSVLAEREVLAAAAQGVLTDEEQVLLQWTAPPRAPGSAHWSSADAVLIDEARDVVERTPSLGHVVLDEAQDLSPMQLRAVGRRCSTAAATVLGDLAQGTTPWASADWATTLVHLGQPGAAVEVLERGYRVPAAVIDFASRLLPTIAPGVAAPVSVRENRGTLDFVGGDVTAALATAVRAALGQPGSVGVIVADHGVAGARQVLRTAHIEHDVLGTEEASHRVALVAATLAKGLEFDHVVVVEPDDIVAAEPSRWIGLRRLYVVLTRAVSGLTVVHSRPLPAELVQSEVA
jgi:DNA helicase IV